MRDSVRSLRKWWYLPAISMATIGTVAIAVGEVPRTFKTGDTLTAADLNANFAAQEQRLAAAEKSLAALTAGQAPRTIARAHGVGPNDATTSGAIASRVLQYTKAQDATGLRIAWNDNIRCTGADPSCEWELKIDGASCAMPGPLKFDLYNAASNVTVNIHGPRSFFATCFGIPKGPHTIQVYVTAPATGYPTAGTPYTGWNAAYWSLEVEEVL